MSETDGLCIEANPSRHSRLGRHHTHDGILFRGRYSHLQLEGDTLSGRESDAGILIPAFPRDTVWFSMIWGDYADDLLAVEVDERVTGPLPRIPHEGTQPLGQFVEWVQEFQLDGPVKERLGLVLLELHDYRIDLAGAVKREVNLHDHCFWSVRPIDPPTLRALAHQQLALHEEYLGCEDGLASYVEPLCELLSLGAEVKLKSKPEGFLRVRFGGRGLSRRTNTWWPASGTSGRPGSRI